VFDIDSVEYHILSSYDADEENTVTWEINGWRYYLRSLTNVEILLEIALLIG